MTKQIVLRAPRSMIDRRQPLLRNEDCSSRGGRRRRLAEVAGGTTAECAAVCCCCPCGLVTLVILAVYKVPAGLCRKALTSRRRRRRRKQLMQQQGSSNQSMCGGDDMRMMKIQLPINEEAAVDGEVKDVTDEDVAELEKEMWDRFYSAGFWRSWSQRSQNNVSTNFKELMQCKRNLWRIQSSSLCRCAFWSNIPTTQKSTGVGPCTWACIFRNS